MKPCFYFTTLLSVAAVAICIVVLLSTSSNKNLLHKVYWSKGNYGLGECGDFGLCSDIFVGLFQFNVRIDADLIALTGASERGIKWTDSECDQVFDYCDEAQQGGIAVTCLVAFALLFSFLSIYSNLRRARMGGNSCGSKCGASTYLTLALLCSIASVVVFYYGQRLVEKDDSELFSDVDWKYGPSFKLMIAVCALSFVNMLLNLFLPIGGDESTTVVRQQGRGDVENQAALVKQNDHNDDVATHKSVSADPYDHHTGTTAAVAKPESKTHYGWY